MTDIPQQKSQKQRLLAAALRQNLARRKAQQKARRDSSEPDQPQFREKPVKPPQN